MKLEIGNWKIKNQVTIDSSQFQVTAFKLLFPVNLNLRFYFLQRKESKRECFCSLFFQVGSTDGF